MSFEYDPAWKNSEIARLFIEAAAAVEEQDCGDEPEPLKATEVETHPDGSVEVELEPKVAAADPEKISAEFDAWRVQQSLLRLASQAAQGGNLKGAYLIERMLAGLDSD